MAIAALVLHLDPTGASSVIGRLSAHPALTLGEQRGLLLPAVADSRDLKSGEELFEEIRAEPGVRFVDVVMVDFSDEES